MIIEEIMTRDVATIRPEQSLLDAAELMRSRDVGSLPVHENDRLIGMITDRDIVVRGLTDNDVAGKTVRDVMSEEVMYCRAGDQVESVATNMADLEMRRLPVVDDHKRLVGIVSLANMMHSKRSAAQTMGRGVATPH
ncbi:MULTISPECIES: CBS domain-containing protein [unclassified Pseudoxanthomonas]|jgi:CBS domain-containing protein|uniref:CBS domain-containing protein n=1 Tax=unclassified Pseudoxanthomonas TaxID=2645906 RepID=UPI001608EEF2|nr:MULTISPECIES: CBS domain-containing protein [unclassified Pseudoxanthomonas]MBB3278115.1 CBS domain-containing protein [Pseudoxanthomonas sp. OG2]MBV7475907.1 CBS domain-containing protein [Pseudoxanthomonas sp. PXM05]